MEVGSEVEEVNFVVVLLDAAAGLFVSENRENKANKEDESDTILPKGTQNGSNVKHHLSFVYLPYYNTLFLIRYNINLVRLF